MLFAVLCVRWLAVFPRTWKSFPRGGHISLLPARVQNPQSPKMSLPLRSLLCETASNTCRVLMKRNSIYRPYLFWLLDFESHRGGPPCSKIIKTLTCGFSTTCTVLFLYQIAPFLKIILEQSKRPRLEVGHQGAVFQHPGANAGVPLQQLMPTAQGKARRREISWLRKSVCREGSCGPASGRDARGHGTRASGSWGPATALSAGPRRESAPGPGAAVSSSSGPRHLRTP